MHTFSSVEPRSESTFPFWCIIIFQRWQYLEPRAPLLEEINLCAHWGKKGTRSQNEPNCPSRKYLEYTSVYECKHSMPLWNFHSFIRVFLHSYFFALVISNCSICMSFAPRRFENVSKYSGKLPLSHTL